jgi:lipopolysaccharide transport system ATP-binding protein
MTKAIIQVRNLSKQFRSGVYAPTSPTLREALTRRIKAPFARRNESKTGQSDLLWALKEVNFEVAPGDVVGIIGRNGAGKSTLLTILARIIKPTAGEVDIYGRVGSLLEVGTGFHPDLTGRENIYLNGALLGMRREEIARKFDEIVAFAELERFLETQVKHYSAGMYLRLAFAVAVHFEPEILLLDEVLAVGDASFQPKCIAKMKEISCAGRTVLIVSHDLPSVRQLCSRVLLLESGRLLAIGEAETISAKYLSLVARGEWARAQAPGQ